jgi:3-hydroxyisobutyrate dehydrogenase-like beta-hydroxyacid dehydrogenase
LHVGQTGTGEAVKIVNNILCGAIAEAISVSFVVGVKGFAVPLEMEEKALFPAYKS